MATHSSFLPGESPGQRSLAGCSPWSCQELNMTELPRLCVSLPAFPLMLMNIYHDRHYIP